MVSLEGVDVVCYKYEVEGYCSIGVARLGRVCTIVNLMS